MAKFSSRQVYRISAVLLVGCAFLIMWRAGLPTSPDFVVQLDKSQPVELPVRGGLVPSFEVDTLSGQRLSVDRAMGHPLILNFWATWCVPCEAEMPVLEDLFQAGVPVVGVNVGLEEPLDVLNWLTEHKITFPIVIDDSQRTLEAKYRIKEGLPTTFFVDSNGIIQAVDHGALTEETLRQGLTAIGLNGDQNELK